MAENRERRNPSGSRPAAALRVVLLYAAFASLWILLSDQVAALLVRDPGRLVLVNTFKGWLFVGVTSLLLYRAMRGVRESGESIPVRGWRRILRPVGLAVAVIAGLAWLGARQALVYQERREGERLQAIAALKARQIADWVRERMGDSEFAASSTVWSNAYRKWRDQGLAEGRDQLLGRLDEYRRSEGFASVRVLDGGAWVLPDKGGEVPPQVLEAAGASALDQRIRIVGPYRDAGGVLRLDFLAPLRAAVAGSVPVVVLGADPDRQVSAVLREWPAPTLTGEAVLYRRDGDHLHLISESRFQPGLAVNGRWPLAESRLIIAKVMRGEAPAGTLLDGVDYRGKAVVGLAVPVEGTDWLLLAKMDREEIVAASRPQVTIIGLAALLGAFVAAISASLFRQQRILADSRRERAVQAERFKTLRLLDGIARNSGDAIYALDRQGRRLVFNPEAERLFGMREGDSSDPGALVALAAGQAVLGHGRTETVETVLPTSSGPRTFLLTRGPLADGEGGVEGHFGIARDITDIKWTERHLEVQNRMLARIAAGEPIGALLKAITAVVLDLAPDAMAGILLLDPQDTHLAWAASTGLPPGLAEDRLRIPATLEGGPSGRAVRLRQQVFVEDIQSDPLCDQAMRSHLGRYGIRSVWASPVLGGDGRALGTFSLYRTVPGGPTEALRSLMAAASQAASIALERNREEAELHESEHRFRRLFEAAPVPMCLLSEGGAMTALNSQFTHTFGYTLEEAPSIASWLRPSEGGASFAEGRAALNLRNDPDMEVPLLEATVACKDGGERTVLLSATSLGAESLLTLSDITDRVRAEAERQRLQEEIQQAQKLESIGRLAGGVAHDFNNMLGVIVANADIGLLVTPPGKALDRFEEIKKAAVRSSELTRQLLAFARKQATSPKVLDLNHAIPDMFQMLTRLIGENITLDYEPWPGLWKVHMDPAQLDQVLANLVVNGRDAISGVGRMWIHTENALVEADPAVPFRRPGAFVVLEVGDTGCGMDAERQKHIFEPFFTTKAVGKGTGLGLATVYGIVKQNGGFIEVDSAPGKGTRFRVHLPRHEGETGDLEPVPEALPARRGGETVLVVEDEPMNLDVTAMLLDTLGYRVLRAGGPAEALRALESEGGAVDLLLTDIVMPGMNGRDLAERARALKPGLRVLFMSGYTADIIANQGTLPEDVQLLDKPFTLEDLAARVRSTLDA